MKKFLREDKKAKSRSFFLKKDTGLFDNNLLKFMIKDFKTNKKDLRICLHKDIKAKHHDMIILQQKKNFFLPHKHSSKGETYNILYGSMVCILFKNNGNIKKTILLKKKEIFRTPINIYHTMFPISNFVIFHESKIGQMLKKGDSLFPKWNKKFSSKKEISKFKNKIYRTLK